MENSTDSNSIIFPLSESYKKSSPHYLGSQSFVKSLKTRGIIKFHYLGAKPYLIKSEVMAALKPNPSK